MLEKREENILVSGLVGFGPLLLKRAAELKSMLIFALLAPGVANNPVLLKIVMPELLKRFDNYGFSFFSSATFSAASSFFTCTILLHA